MAQQLNYTPRYFTPMQPNFGEQALDFAKQLAIDTGYQGAGAGIGGLFGGYPIGTTLGGAYGGYLGNQKKKALGYEASLPWDIGGGALGGIIPGGKQVITGGLGVFDNLGDDALKALDDLYKSGRTDDILNAIEETTTNPFKDLPANINKFASQAGQKAQEFGQSLMNRFNQTPNVSQPIYEQYGLGKVFSPGEMKKFKKELGLGNKFQYGDLETAIRDKILPELNKQNQTFLKFRDDITTPFNPFDDLVTRGGETAAKPLEDFTSKVLNPKDPFQFLQDAGEMAQQRAGKVYEGFNRVYPQLFKGFEGVKAPGATIQKEAQNILNEGKDIFAKNPYKIATEQAQQALKGIQENAGVGIENIRGTRTYLRNLMQEKAQSLGGQEKTLLGNLKKGYTATQKELATLADPTGQLSTRLSKADELYGKNYKQVFDPKQSSIAKTLKEYSTFGGTQTPKITKTLDPIIKTITTPQQAKKFTQATGISGDELLDQIEGDLINKHLGSVSSAFRQGEGELKNYFSAGEGLSANLKKMQSELKNYKATFQALGTKGQKRYQLVSQYLHELGVGAKKQNLFAGLLKSEPSNKGGLGLATDNLDFFVAKDKDLSKMTPETKAMFRKIQQLNNELNKVSTGSLRKTLHKVFKGIKEPTSIPGSLLEGK